jgi:IS5 family transposase
MREAVQQSFSDMEFAGKKRRTRKEIFLCAMDELVPWAAWLKIIEPHYPKAGRGRRPLGLERMLRMYLVANWFNLSDEMAEDSVYDVQSVRQFVGVNLSQEDAPDATTLCKFRQILVENNLTEKLHNELARLLKKAGFLLTEGTIVDASIVEAPKSTKNADRARDPEMAGTWKGGKPFFGEKIHVGVDKVSGLIHGVTVTPANVADVTMAHELLHGGEEEIYGDSGYIGLDLREEMADEVDLRYQINLRPGMVSRMPEGALKEEFRVAERAKSHVRAKVEWSFHIIKDLFGYRKARYKGLVKNAAQVTMLAALANLKVCQMRCFSPA